MLLEKQTKTKQHLDLIGPVGQSASWFVVKGALIMIFWGDYFKLLASIVC